MSRTSLLQDLLTSIVDRRTWLPEALGGSEPRTIEALCSALMSTRGEASGTALAARILAAFRTLDEDGQRTFFENLAAEYDPDPEQAWTAAEAYRQNRTPDTLAALVAATEPPRQELLRRLNQAPGGTAALVQMRACLLKILANNPHLGALDADFIHMFSSWFNRGFLVLQPVDWQTPAHILDKIIDYEAVHAIDNWDELRRRLQPTDRRCFAFFHPSMPDEPLVFVEVALTRDVPVSIQALLAEDREVLAIERASTAVFYSISNCQVGLRGVSFGSFLIKQVAEDLKREAPSIKTFVTLSPVPGLLAFLKRQSAEKPDTALAALAERVSEPGWSGDDEAVEADRKLLLGLAAHYFLNGRRADRQPLDPVARFHLGNGARLLQINWRGDVSEKGFAQSSGIMVNYEYDLDRIELNHEAYATDREIIASRRVRSHLPAPEGLEVA
ncbi:MAG: malonyl-CoA decarboxylase [Pseudomonadota bacterium]